ncbi:MAG TPA: hypothetical protein VK738_05755 [Terriglobales bacterium]|jgi:hypothetical protein|nr:hypothetical protein [Terriglobales bacterium]
MQAEATNQPNFTPYKNEAVNHIYNLLFCDNPEAFSATLLAENANDTELRAIAEDESQESRLRMRAYNRLREKKELVPAKKLLGVIIEVGLENGLDVLAAFPDGRARYINYSEKMSIFEASPPEVQTKIRKLLDASQPVVERIGPWEKARLAPPPMGTIRMTFLVSDGFYFGQGPLNVMQRDAMAGPVITAGVELLQAVANATRGTPSK